MKINLSWIAAIVMMIPIVTSADTTDREHAANAPRQDSGHIAAWETLLDEQSTSRAGGGLFRRAGCGVGDFNKPECVVERDNDSGGGGHDH